MVSPDHNLVPQLTEVSGPYAGRVHELPYGEHVIGRGAEATIQLEDQDVSRRHARLDVGPDGVTVQDLESKNGVFVSGQRINRPVRLTHGDIFALGDLVLSVSHPPSQVSRALNAAGEKTVTTTRTDEEEQGRRPSLLLPVLAVVVFGGLVVALLLM